MDKRFNKKVETYVSEFKSEICNMIRTTDENDKNKLIEYIYEYPRLTFDKEDFIKRKRLKNSIPSVNRCAAKRANGEQCTRRKKDDGDFCGTHYKNAPHGLITNKSDKKNIEVFTEDIKGIIYYVDDMKNVYKMDDIIQGKENPKVIAKYEKNDDVSSIVEFYS